MSAPVGVRRATIDDADVVAGLLHDFNVEFDAPTPGPAVLATRLRRHLPTGDLVALLHGAPPDALALVSFRATVWSDGPVALLDELYVRPDRRDQGIGSALLAAVESLAGERGTHMVEVNVDGEDVDARRFYAAHGYRHVEPGAAEPSYYYLKEW